MSDINLFCVPFAGGSALAFMKWKKLLKDKIELCPVELSGRGSRIDSPLYNTFSEAVDDVYNMIKNDIDQKPYALFGHSMGCWIIYELYYRIKENNHRLPIHLFLSGRRAPDIKKDGEVFHKYPLEKLKEKILEFGGTPLEFFQNEEILKFYLPIIRSDFKITESYQYSCKNQKINCNVSVMSGKSDNSITSADLIGWKKHINGEFTIKKYDGGHFFIQDSMKEVIDLINLKLA